MNPSEMPVRLQCPVTIGDIKRILADLPDDSALIVGIRDPQHCNELVGEIPVDGAWLMPRGEGHAVVLDVPGLS